MERTLSIVAGIRRLISEGFSVEQALAAAEAFEQPIARTARQERNARYYQKIGKHRPRGREWRALRKSVFDRDNWKCVYCGNDVTAPHCDHVIPVTRGGMSDLSNLATACGSCNASKNNRVGWRRS